MTDRMTNRAADHPTDNQADAMIPVSTNRHAFNPTGLGWGLD
jgi:hypothetical protein